MTVFLPFPLVPRLGAGFSFGLSPPLVTVYPKTRPIIPPRLTKPPLCGMMKAMNISDRIMVKIGVYRCVRNRTAPFPLIRLPPQERVGTFPPRGRLSEGTLLSPTPEHLFFYVV